MMRNSKFAPLFIALVSTLFFAGCEKDEFSDAPTVKASAATQEAAPVADTKELPSDHPPVADTTAKPLPPAQGATRFASPADFGKTGPLRWTAPEGWTAAAPASSMRLAEYVVNGDAGPATMSIFYFGAGGGGGVEANVTRWIGQFTKPDGTPATDIAERATAKVNTMNVHRVAVEGTFNAGMAGSGQSLENQRMMGAIVESPAGLYFFKLVGPKATIDAKSAEFDAFVASFKPAEG